MALTKITPEIVAVNAIQGTLIADNAITAVHIATNAVSGTLIADNAVTATHIAQNVITVTQLADDAVEADKIADGVITTNHLNKAMISSQTEVTAASGDYVLLGDTSDSNNLKKALVSDLGNDLDAAVTINESGADVDFRIESDDNTHMLFINGGNDTVSIGTAADYSTPPLKVYGTAINQNSGYYQLALESDLTATSTPRAGISFRGEYNTSNNAHMDLGIIQGEKENSTNAETGGQLTFHTRANQGNITERMRIRSSGGVGIGTAGYATQILAVNSGTENTVFYGESTDADCYASFRVNSSTVNVMIGATGNNLCAQFDGTEKMRIASNGDVSFDSFSYSAASDQMTINNGLFLTSGYIRSGAADFSLGTASNGVMVTLDDSSNRVWAAGHVMQVVQATGGAEIMTSGTFNETGLEADITPLKASSKVLVTVTSAGTYNNGTAGLGIAIFRDATEVCHHVVGGSSGNQYFPISMSFLDSPNTTSAITYTVQHRSENGSSLVGFVSTDPGGDDVGFLQLMEIGGA